MSLRFLKEYAVEFKKMDERAFRAKVARPSLIGLGLVGEITEAKTSGTLSMSRRELDADMEAAGLQGRVWVIRRAEGGRRDAGITAGRSSENDIVIPEYTVSKRHCLFRVEIGRILIEDLNSYNGTYVDGKRLRSGFGHPLQDGMVVSLGRFGFKYVGEDGFVSEVRAYLKR